MPPLDPARAQSKRRDALERDIARLLERREHGEDIETRWLELALSLFHGVGRQRGRAMVRAASIDRNDDGFHLSHEGEMYYVPQPPGGTI